MTQVYVGGSFSVVVVVVVLPRRVFVEGPAAAGHRPARAATLDPRGVSDKRKILEQAQGWYVWA